MSIDAVIIRAGFCVAIHAEGCSTCVILLFCIVILLVLHNLDLAFFLRVALSLVILHRSGVSPETYPSEVMELPLPEDELNQALLDLILANDPSRIDIIHEVLFEKHEDFDDMGTDVPTLFLKLAIATPLALLLLAVVDGSSLVQPYAKDAATCLNLKPIPRSN